MSTVPVVVGVDAGGTKTLAVCTRVEDGLQEAGRFTAGPGNLRAVGEEAAIDAIRQAIVEATAGIERIDALCIGAAGAGRPEEQNVLSSFASTITSNFLVTHDAATVLAAGCSDFWGVALISGTGSLAYGCNASGKEARAGGWGYLFGDEGSGYAIGIEALRQVAKAVDGRGPQTALTAALFEHLGIASAARLVAAVYQGPLTRDQLARIGGLVLTCAAEGDAVADSILDNAAQDLAQAVHAVVKSLALPTGYELALAGGILCNSPRLQLKLHKQLAELHCTPGSTEHVPEPVLGAVRLAQRLLTTA